jgi:hypothetical protein
MRQPHHPVRASRPTTVFLVANLCAVGSCTPTPWVSESGLEILDVSTGLVTIYQTENQPIADCGEELGLITAVAESRQQFQHIMERDFEAYGVGPPERLEELAQGFDDRILILAWLSACAPDRADIRFDAAEVDGNDVRIQATKLDYGPIPTGNPNAGERPMVTLATRRVRVQSVEGDLEVEIVDGGVSDPWRTTEEP